MVVHSSSTESCNLWASQCAVNGEKNRGSNELGKYMFTPKMEITLHYKTAGSICPSHTTAEFLCWFARGIFNINDERCRPSAHETLPALDYQPDACSVDYTDVNLLLIYNPIERGDLTESIKDRLVKRIGVGLPIQRSGKKRKKMVKL